MPGDGADQDGRSGAAAARTARNRSDRLPCPVAQWLADGNENIGCLDTTNDRELMYEVTSANCFVHLGDCFLISVNSDQDKWFCFMSPDEQRNACEYPEETAEEVIN